MQVFSPWDKEFQVVEAGSELAEPVARVGVMSRDSVVAWQP
jgi:hypothetical protein